jgi:uncharacterized protein (DUF885 family)
MKSVFSRICSLFLIITLLLTAGCQRNNEDYNAYLDQLFRESIESSPMDIHYTLSHPESFGLEHVKPHMPKFTEESFQEDVQYIGSALSKLTNFNYNKLSQDDKLTYDILKHYFETELLAKDFYYYMEVISPSLGTQAQLPIFFAEYRFDRLDMVESYLGLLGEVPALFDEIVAFQQMKAEKGLLMPTVAIETTLEQIQLFIETPEENFLIEIFEDKINGMDLSEEEKANLITTNESLVLNDVIPAYEKLAHALENLMGQTINEQGLYYLDKGTDYYTYLFKSYTGSSKSVEETIKAIEQRIQNNYAQIITLLQRNSAVIETYMDLSYDFESPEDTMAFLEEAMFDSFSSIGTQPLDIKYVHPSLEDHLSPAFYLIPPIDESKSQVIYINQNENYNLGPQLYTTLAHEGYPGHLYQNVYFRHQEVPYIRQILNFNGYSEGWATYAENLSVEFLDIEDDVKSIMQLDSTTNLLIQARIDIGIHYEGWTVEDTEKYLNMFMPGVDAAYVYQYMLQEPANTLKYAVGYLEFIELRELAEKTRKDLLNIRDFHDLVLTIGPAPFEVLKRELEKWLGIYEETAA